MNNHDTAVHMIEAEINTISTTAFPEMAGSVSRMAVFLANRLDAISDAELEAYLKKIRGLELTRFVQILKGEAA